MSEDILNLKFVWLPNVEDIAEIDLILFSREPDSNFEPTGPILKLEKDLSNFCGLHIFITDIKNSPIEFLFNVVCKLQVEKNRIYDLKRFVSLFLSVRHGKLVPQLYLKCDPSFIDIEATSNTENAAKEITSFSLGNFVGLNTFCERFHSKTTINVCGYKITQNRLVVLHDLKKMLLYFVVGKICCEKNATTHHLHKLEIPYSSLHTVAMSKNEGLTVYIRMLQPPLMYSVIEMQDEECDYTSFHELHNETNWFRAIDLFENCPLFLRKEFSMNTVLKLDLKNEEYDCFYHLMTHCENVQVIFAPVSIVQVPAPPMQLKFKLEDFECSYSLQCLLSHSYEIHDQLIVSGEMEAVKEFLQEKSKENPIALSEAMYLIFEAIVKGNVLVFLSCLKILYERLKLKSCRAAVEDFSSEAPQPKHLFLMKRAIRTPTHLLFLPPQPSLTSRALKNRDPSYALKVIIKDVNMDMLKLSLKSLGQDMQQRHIDFFKEYYNYNKLEECIQIENRCYKYIGRTYSQKNGEAIWFYPKDENQ